MARFIALCTDDQEEAFAKLKEMQEKEPKRPWACADVNQMQDPPKTVYRWVVFRLY